MRKNVANLAPEQAYDVVPTPVSGVRATLKLAGSIPTLDDAGRVPFDSVDRTHVKPPTPALLAIARGEPPAVPRRRTWFALGMFAGAALMWLTIGDVRPTFESARTHANVVMRWIEGAR